MAFKAVKVATNDEFLVVEELERPIKERFKYSVGTLKHACDQWETGLVSDDELGWRAADFARAAADQRKLKTAVTSLQKLAKAYLSHK